MAQAKSRWFSRTTKSKRTSLADSFIGEKYGRETSSAWKDVAGDIYFGVLGGGSSVGSLAVAEVGSDGFAGDGVALVQGDLAVAEVGLDAFSGAGNLIAQGSLAATETGSDVLASSGVVLAAGSLTAAESGQDAAALAGMVLAQGSLTVAEAGSDAFAVSGVALASGALAVVEAGSDSAAVDGAVLVGVDLAATETGSDVFSALPFVVVDNGGPYVVAGYVAAGYFSGDIIEPATSQTPTFHGAGAGPDAQLSLADYLKRFGRTSAHPAAATVHAHDPAALAQRKKRQRMEEEVLALAEIF